MRLKTLTFISGVLISSSALSAPTGSMLAGTCAGCHGTLGKSAGAAPSLAGLDASYIESAMQDFKSGKRPSTIMGRLAKGYDDAEIKAMSAYFGSLK
jgi:sulfide dehydrogenase cytochrome subunit